MPSTILPSLLASQIPNIIAYRLIGFQLAYDRPMDPYALTWHDESGYYHQRVDDGECPDTTAFKGIPILIANGQFDFKRVGWERILRVKAVKSILRSPRLSMTKSCGSRIFDKD